MTLANLLFTFFSPSFKKRHLCRFLRRTLFPKRLLGEHPISNAGHFPRISAPYRRCFKVNKQHRARTGVLEFWMLTCPENSREVMSF